MGCPVELKPLPMPVRKLKNLSCHETVMKSGREPLSNPADREKTPQNICNIVSDNCVTQVIILQTEGYQDPA